MRAFKVEGRKMRLYPQPEGRMDRGPQAFQVVSDDGAVDVFVQPIDRVGSAYPVKELGFSAFDSVTGRVNWQVILPRPMLFGEGYLERLPDAERWHLDVLISSSPDLATAYKAASFVIRNRKHWER